MQGLDTSTGNKILKFSVLMEMLPYWDAPIKWRYFCMSMNKKTQEIWKIHYKAFNKRAEKFKRSIKYSKKITEAIVTSIVNSYQLFSKLTLGRKDVKSLLSIVKRLKDERVVILHPSKINQGYTISITKKKDHLENVQSKSKAQSKQNYEYISKSNTAEIKELIHNNLDTNFIVIKRMKILLKFEILNTNQWSEFNIDDQSDSEVESNDFINKRDDFLISKPSDRLFGFDNYVSKDTIIKSKKEIKICTDCIDGISELFEVLEHLKSKRKIKFESSGMYYENATEKPYKFMVISGRISFVKYGDIYSVNLNATKILFNGNLKYANRSHNGWSIYELTSFIAYDYMVSYNSVLENLIEREHRSIINSLSRFDDYLLIIKNDNVVINEDIQNYNAFTKSESNQNIVTARKNIIKRKDMKQERFNSVLGDFRKYDSYSIGESSYNEDRIFLLKLEEEERKKNERKNKFTIEVMNLDTCADELEDTIKSIERDDINLTIKLFKGDFYQLRLWSCLDRFKRVELINADGSTSNKESGKWVK